WTVQTAATAGCVYVVNENGKYISWSSKGNFAAYTFDATKEADYALELYVKTADASHVHTWDEGKVTTEPTCTEKGVKTYTCTVCKETKTEAIAALGHVDADKDNKCDRCGATISTPATGKYVPATSFEDGDKIVIVATQDNKLLAMSSEIKSSVAPAVEVTATTEGALSEVSDAIVWTIVKAEDGTFYLTVGDKKLKVDGGALSLVAEGVTFAISATSVSATTPTTTPRALFTQKYNGSYRFKNYATSNLGAANYASGVTVYKYVAG
ncbi:MAG: hypothetical protein SOX74_08125, partial [Candidatus Faecousia sp.]|uniref:hypothetical protein n=1 Tax=Faecousia sp. TaxID=2952921 RepID=UPI002A8BBE2F|nr:hypothetical protein [Candidatus Faecousia sp.]